MSELGIGVVLVVEYLALRSRDEYRLHTALGVLGLLCEVEYAGVGTLAHLPLHVEDEVLELMREDDVAALFVLALLFWSLIAHKVNCTVVNHPASWHIASAIASPALHGLAVKYCDVTLAVNGEFISVPLFRTLECL